MLYIQCCKCCTVYEERTAKLYVQIQTVLRNFYWYTIWYSNVVQQGTTEIRLHLCLYLGMRREVCRQLAGDWLVFGTKKLYWERDSIETVLGEKIL